MNLKKFWTNLILFSLIINLIFSFKFISINADSNPPQDMGNGWYNSTVPANWIIDSTNNYWNNTNISINQSIMIKDGGELIFINCTVLVNYTVEVKINASLTLINTTLIFNNIINGTSELHVFEGGSLFILDYDNDSKTKYDGSNITSTLLNNQGRYGFIIEQNSNLTFRNSELHNCGYPAPQEIYFGLNVFADNSIIENNTFSNNYAGLIVGSSNNIIKNNNFFENEKYGLLVFFGRNNTLDNNTINNNKYNFGLRFSVLNQSNNITLNNTIDSKPIYYFEGINDFELNSSLPKPGFIGVVNLNNITVSDHTLKENFNSMIYLGGNNSKIRNCNFTDNEYGVFLRNSNDIEFTRCMFSNNKNGMDLITTNDNIVITNSSFKNNTIGMEVYKSNITIMNSTFLNNSNYDIVLEENSYVCAINCTLNSSMVTASKLEVKNFLHIRTKNHTGIPIGNVSLEIYDGNNNLVHLCKSNATGFIKWIPCTNYIITGSGTNSSASNHRIYTKFAGIEFNQYVKMNCTRNITFNLNHPPAITNKLANVTYVDEDSIFVHDFNFTDQDSDNVNWYSMTNAKWMNAINLTTGIINGTPTDFDVGNYFLNISCNDSYLGFTFYNFTIRVNNTNDRPSITSKQGAESAFEDRSYFHDFGVSDPDYSYGDSHNWSMETDADWLNPIHKLYGRLFGDPTQNDVGEYFVNVSCMDKEGEVDNYNFTLTVYPTNDIPIITNPCKKLIEIDEENTFYYDFNFTDVDLELVTWDMVTNATWLAKINSSTGEVIGIPHDNDVGLFFVNILCIDSNNSIAYWNFSILVHNTNDPPYFMDKQNQIFNIDEDKYFEQTFSIFDPDIEDEFKFSMTTNKKELTRKFSSQSRLNITWMRLNIDQAARTCTVYGTPENDDVGIVLINLTCTDSFGISTFLKFSIVINNTNDAPIIINLENRTTYILEDHEYYHDFNYLDDDGDSVTWSINTNAYWISGINSDSGELSGIPTQESLGKYFVMVYCTDPSGDFDFQNYTIIVNNTNDPPIITNPCPKIVYVLEDKSYEYDFNSLDLDSSKLFWTSSTDANWLNPIQLNTGIIFGTPDNNDVGQYFVNITCFDDKYDSTSWNYTIIVNNTNDAPRIINKGVQFVPDEVNINEEYYFKFKYYDPDGDKATWRINTNASIWLNLNFDTGVLLGTPSRLDIGYYNVNVSCIDPYDAIDYYEYKIYVLGTKNRPPELYGGFVEPNKGEKDTEFTFYVTYRDIDYDEPITVVVMINEKPNYMDPVSGDDLFVGVVYSYTTKLKEGNNIYYFQAMDELYARAVIFDDTPSYNEPRILEVSENKVIEEESVLQMYYWHILLLIIIIVIILIILGVVLSNRKSRLLKTTKAKKKQRLKHVKAKHIKEIEPRVSPDVEVRGLNKVKLEPSLIDEAPTVEGEPLEGGEAELISEPELKGSDLLMKALEGIGDEASEKDDLELIEDVDVEVQKVEPEQEPEQEPKPGLETETSVDDKKELTKQEFEEKVQDELHHDLMICPQCGEFVNETFDSCPNCGVKFIFDDAESESDDKSKKYF